MKTQRGNDTALTSSQRERLIKTTAKGIIKNIKDYGLVLTPTELVEHTLELVASRT